MKNAVSRRTGEGGNPSRSPVRHKPERGISSANGGDFRVLMTGASIAFVVTLIKIVSPRPPGTWLVC
jgi:hypothetical protein